MALRAFQNNPSIGGFGNESSTYMNIIGQDCRPRHPKVCTKHNDNVESQTQTGLSKQSASRKSKTTVNTSSSSTSSSNQKSKSYSNKHNNNNGCDAFAQIIKELVDNAVDACRNCNGTSSHLSFSSRNREEIILDEVVKDLKRVRVTIEKVISTNNEIHANENSSSDEENNVEHDNYNDGDDDESNEVLRVTVTDNGCGMDNIENCVSVFSSSKSGQVISSNSKNNSTTNKIEKDEDCTAGRYGLGLTLCLLHAQRLVPNSCASIISSTSKQTVWTSAKFVVDAEKDEVVCVAKKWKEKKKHGCHDSGTSVSLLVPGGRDAKNAWPRLAEYFARFQLSLGLQCSLEVMAPSLSSRPLYIRPIYERNSEQRSSNLSPLDITDRIKILEESIPDSTDRNQKDDKDSEDDSNCFVDIDGNDDIIDWIASTQYENVSNEKSLLSISSPQAKDVVEEEIDGDDDWIDILNENNDPNETLESQTQKDDSSRPELECKKETSSNDQNQPNMMMRRRIFIQSAVSKYLQKSIPLENFAHCSQPIRSHKSKAGKEARPTLEVDMIVCSNSDPSINDNDDIDELSEDEIEGGTYEDAGSAKMLVIRMVNHIPLLDGGEAMACGIVKGVSEKRRLWNSFGLDVSPLGHSLLGKTQKHAPNMNSLLHTPTFTIRDNAQVSHYFTASNHVHSQFEDYSDDDESSCDCSDEKCRGKRKKKKQSMLLLPAEIRLGKILLIVQLHAKPVHLPMPTLSKGRLPLNNKNIDEALEVCISSCLKSLQKSNPALLLTGSQLKKSERDCRFLPSISEAITSIVLNCNDQDMQQDMLDIMNSWKEAQEESVSIITPEVPNSQFSFESRSEDEIEGLSKMHSDSLLEQSVHRELSSTIETQFRRVIKIVEERKIEQSKKAKADYSHKKKAAKRNDDDDSAKSSCTSTADLDAFIASEERSAQLSNDSKSVSLVRNSRKKGAEKNIGSSDDGSRSSRKNDMDDFDDDDWW